MHHGCCLLALLIAAYVRARPENLSSAEKMFVHPVEKPLPKRSLDERAFQLSAFGHQIELNLKRQVDVLPENLQVLVYGENADGEAVLEDMTHRSPPKQSLYSDVNSGASLLIDDSGDTPKMTGKLGNNLLIAPDVFIYTEEDKEMESKREIGSRHVIYRATAESSAASRDDFVDMKREELEELEDDTGKTKRAVPERIYVPVHVVVDYALWKKLARSEADVITYIKIFYNGVNDIYSQISWPSVSISLQGITICKTASACAMVESAIIGTNTVNAKASLDKIAVYAYDQRDVTGIEYAVMMVMTDYDLCSPSSSGSCERSTAGLAFVASACDTFRGKTSRVGISEDHASFDGIKVVSHEIGHLLGIKHDGDGQAKPGAPGATNCKWSDNYIMGDSAMVINSWKWSPCSVEQLRWYSVQPEASCLLMKPSSAPYPLDSRLPGKVLDTNSQCKALFGSASFVHCEEPGINSGNDKMCTSLMCSVGGNSCRSTSAAAEGSYCGPQRYCRLGKCICDPTAPKPTVPVKEASCQGDNTRILINGKSCVNLLTGVDGLKSCNTALVKQHCCDSRWKYCRATPITCTGNEIPITPKPTPPKEIFTLAQVTTQRPWVDPTDINCGKPCVDTPNMRISGQTCAQMLGTTAGKQSYCDNPTVIQHCCATRKSVCAGFHWITHSCDDTCKDNPNMQINGLKCLPFLSTKTQQENFCSASISKEQCCASQRKFCAAFSNPFGR